MSTSRWYCLGYCLVAGLAVGCASTGRAQETVPEPDVAQSPEAVEPARLACAFEGEPAERYARNCELEIARYEERTGRLAEGITRLEQAGRRGVGSIRAALAVLVERRRQICADWNACAASRDEHLELYDWLSDELAAFEGQLDETLESLGDEGANEELTAWAQALSSRRPGATNRTAATDRPTASGESPVDSSARSPAPATRPTLPEEARRRLTATLRSQEQEIVEFREMIALLRELRTDSAGASISAAPPLCSSEASTRRRLATLVRGPNSTVSGYSNGLTAMIADLCGRYTLQRSPDERVAATIARLFAHLDRVDGWMDDILRCTLPGANQGRCRNAYGGRQPDDIAEAQRAKQLVASMRSTLAGTQDGSRPFPCDLDLPAELDRAAWTLTVARAQMPRIRANVETVCRHIGLDERGLEPSVARLSQLFDTAESSLGTTIRVREDALARIREVIE